MGWQSSGGVSHGDGDEDGDALPRDRQCRGHCRWGCVPQVQRADLLSGKEENRWLRSFLNYFFFYFWSQATFGGYCSKSKREITHPAPLLCRGLWSDQTQPSSFCRCCRHCSSGGRFPAVPAMTTGSTTAVREGGPCEPCGAIPGHWAEPRTPGHRGLLSPAGAGTSDKNLGQGLGTGTGDRDLLMLLPTAALLRNTTKHSASQNNLQRSNVISQIRVHNAKNAPTFRKIGEEQITTVHHSCSLQCSCSFSGTRLPTAHSWR